MLMRRAVPLILLAASACTNLKDVRDYANTAATVTNQVPVFESWPHTYDVAYTLAGSPQMRKFDPDAQLLLQDNGREAAARNALAIQATRALALYLTTLGELADDKLADVSQPASTITAAAQKLGATNPALSAYSSAVQDLIQVVLRGVQEQAIKKLIRDANADVLTITEFLDKTAFAVRQADVNAADAVQEYWRVTGSLSNDVAVHELVKLQMRDDDAVSLTKRQQAEAASELFQKIAAQQSNLYNSVDHLDAPTLRQTLTTETHDLLAILKLFQNT
jgi:hypothetical protein